MIITLYKKRERKTVQKRKRGGRQLLAVWDITCCIKQKKVQKKTKK